MSILSIDVYVLSVILLLTLCSIVTRCTYLLFGDYLRLSAGVRSALRYAPVAALAGIVIPELLPLQQDVGVVISARPFAAGIAVLLFWRTRSTLAVIIGGMLAFWVLDAVWGVVF